MGTLKRVGSLSVLAAGLGIGAALAATPGVAFAGTSSVDGGAGALGVVAAFAAADIGDAAVAGIGAAGAITPPTLPDDYANFAISFSGIPLYQSGTAFAVSDFGNLAIAHGDGSVATAWHGMFNYASADGHQSVAYAGDGGTHGTGGWFNTATAAGDNSYAYAFGGGSGNVASATGDYAGAYSGVANGGVLGGNSNTATAEGAHAFAGAGYDASSNNVASAIGDNTNVLVPDTGSSAADANLFGNDATDFWADLWHLFS